MLLSPLPWGGVGGISCPFVLLSDKKDGYPVLLSGLRPEGALICQPRAAPGELDAAWIRPRRGQKNDSPPLENGKGVGEIIIILPILGECWLRTIPKALPWADLFLAFLSPLCFESEQARAQAVFTPTVYTPLPWGGVGGDVKPTPALPKGGGIMSFCPSVRYEVTPHLKILYRGLKARQNAAII